MGMHKYMMETFEKEYSERSPIYRARLVKWAKEPTVSRVERPTNLARARTLGFKAKQGYIIVRVKAGRGSRKRPHPMGGRKPGKNVAYRSPEKSYQAVAEEKAATKFTNMEVLNSYWVGATGINKYFEVILVDPVKVDIPAAKAVGRAFRGLTSAGKKHRGLWHKGKGAEKMRKANGPWSSTKHGRP